jgi:AAA domain, putative AbiEii toxin, Type IV TA system
VALASDGVRRVLALAYFLVWTWHEHRMAAELLDRDPEDRFVILFDEPETHLHPRWQPTIVPSALAAIDVLRGNKGPPPQLFIATHAPLVLASVEPMFSPELDELFHLKLDNGKVVLETGGWTTQGDVSEWLLSNVFGLEQARSIEAERAIEAAEALMRGERRLPQGLADDAFLDPYLVKRGWFEILLPSLQMQLTSEVPASQRARAMNTLTKLKLDNGEKIVRWRRRYYELFQKGRINLDGLRELAPLVADAVEREQRTNARAKPSKRTPAKRPARPRGPHP